MSAGNSHHWGVPWGFSVPAATPLGVQSTQFPRGDPQDGSQLTMVGTNSLIRLFGFSSGLALPLGLITGLMSLIPMFGSLIGGFLVAILLAFNTWPAGLIFLAYTIIYLQIESNVICYLSVIPF